MKKRWRILVVDDEEVARDSLAAWLREDGYSVETASGGREAILRATDSEFAICFVDLKMPGGMDGIETMSEIRRLRPDASVVIITAYATVETAITAMKEGAEEYIVKPFNLEEISHLVERIVRVRELEWENALLRKKLDGQYRVHDIISKNPRMHEIFGLIGQVAGLRSTVLIQGESGTGKELVARAIHSSGDRAGKPFITVSCAALAETLLESELFGYEKGAFTGAAARKKGKFELADGGSILLDEIGDIPAKLQTDLLRVLQERSFYRVGGTEEVRVDVRVIAATNLDLQSAVRAGTFRSDLFYRLNVINIRIPPLRERREDIPLLARHLMDRLAGELGKEIEDVSEEALELLLSYDWPGNVRELENALERAFVTCPGKVLGRREFAFLLRDGPAPGWSIPPDLSLRDLEKLAIAATLDRTRGNVRQTARILGIDRSTLYEKLRKYEIPR
jgi:DNA-binding NtrC family response regulator